MSQTSKLGKCATWVFLDGGKTCIQYHYTVVVDFDEKTIKLNSGGWRTVTTKTRMNQASNQYGLGFIVFQEDFTWFVEYNGQIIPFQDGMELKR